MESAPCDNETDYDRVMIVSVQTDIEKAISQLKSLTEREQFNRSVRRALNKTAEQVQTEVRNNMPARFTLRRNWVVKGILIKYASNSSLTATVYSRDKFMKLQETGGQKNALRNYIAIPTSMVKRTKTDIIRKSDRPGALGDKAEIIELNGHKWLALKKARKTGGGQRLKLLYLLVPRAQMKERLGLAKDGMRIARQHFVSNLRDALDQAVRAAQ